MGLGRFQGDFQRILTSENGMGWIPGGISGAFLAWRMGLGGLQGALGRIPHLEDGEGQIPGAFWEDLSLGGSDWEHSRGILGGFLSQRMGLGGFQGVSEQLAGMGCARLARAKAGTDSGSRLWEKPLGRARGKSQREEAADAAGLEICWKQTDGPRIPGEWKSLDGGMREEQGRGNSRDGGRAEIRE